MIFDSSTEGKEGGLYSMNSRHRSIPERKEGLAPGACVNMTTYRLEAALGKRGVWELVNWF